MSRRAEVIGAAAGVAAAAGAAGAVALNRTLAKRRHPDLAAISEARVDRSGRVVANDGVGLYYEEVGSLDAPLTIVFAHAFCLRMGEFCFQRRALADHFGDGVRLVFYDQRSHGRSDRSDAEHTSIDQLGQDLAAVLDALVPAGRVVLVGHSMGGMTVMALADAFPELFGSGGRIAGVALISTSAGKLASVTLGLPAVLARLRSPLLPLLLRGARRQSGLVERGRALGGDVAWLVARRLSFGGSNVDPALVGYLATMIAATRIDVIADYYPTVMSHDKIAALPVLAGVQTAIICGDRDVLTPLAHSERIAAELPQAHLVVVPDASHLVLMECPEAVDEVLIGMVEAALADGPPDRSPRRKPRRA
ncbi:MAG TPA: alpha/beta hydrolase [Jatrophihabitantaceae bacterium]|nr:alpha/beta hydrolase [Jatrophihabitantaceae bacterium]